MRASLHWIAATTATVEARIPAVAQVTALSRGGFWGKTQRRQGVWWGMIAGVEVVATIEHYVDVAHDSLCVVSTHLGDQGF